MGEVETKPVLVGHIELEEGGEPPKMEAEMEEPDNSTEGKIPCKQRVTQSTVAYQAYKAAVYYFLFNTVDQKKTVANQAVADQFKVSKSNLHRITSGRKYAGGSITTGRKLKSVQELEEHGNQWLR